ncbi:fibronectin type III domain-containing protein [Seonamhaeicola sp.]|uniref:fibronectin type III domain-containing protein n=1 Tax=Seonamhaeicola sp. TaxID=1912245 RepID=UPI00260DE34C|nr:fibronectin type III domain-containing protein [Seonamhaeicola sp.]
MKKLLLFLVFMNVLSCDEIIEVADISDKTVEILAPTNNSVIDATSVSFTWNALEDAESYKLQIATPDFENAVQIVVDSTLANTSFIKTLAPGTYEWRLRAENSGYQTQYTINGFTVSE